MSGNYWFSSYALKKGSKNKLKSVGKKIFNAIELLKANNFDAIPKHMKPHKLIGNYKGCLEYHIMPDLLIIRQDNAEKEIYLLDISSHSALFLETTQFNYLIINNLL